jgi:aminobenzoyl-glutamate transport protein
MKAKSTMHTVVGVACLVLFLAEAVLVLLSWILSAMGLEGIRSLLSSEGIRWFFGDFTWMVASPWLVWLMLLLIALGAFQRSGLTSLLHSGLHKLSYRDRTALRVAFLLLVFYIIAILLLTVFPHAILLSASGTLFPSPFSRSIVPFIAFGIALVSIAFGLISGRMQSLSDILRTLSFGLQKGAPLLVLYIFFIQFYESLWFVFS